MELKEKRQEISLQLSEELIGEYQNWAIQDTLGGLGFQRSRYSVLSKQCLGEFKSLNTTSSITKNKKYYPLKWDEEYQFLKMQSNFLLIKVLNEDFFWLKKSSTKIKKISFSSRENSKDKANGSLSSKNNSICNPKLILGFIFLLLYGEAFFSQTLSQTRLANNVNETANSNPCSIGNWVNYSSFNLSLADSTNTTFNDTGLNYRDNIRECTNYLDFSDFNFSIPPNSIVEGIVFSMTRRKMGTGTSSLEDNEIRLLVNGSPRQVNKSNREIYNDNTFTTVYFGGNDDKWGDSLSDLEINSSSFGVRISIARNDTSGPMDQVPEIDQINLTIYYSENPLPVQLLYFKGDMLPQNTRQLNWATATETNSYKFILERFDNQNFNQIAEIHASGNTSYLVKYEFIDNEYVEDTIIYYRLCQIDFNGDKEYFPILSIRQTFQQDLEIYPNPSKAKVSIRYTHRKQNEQMSLMLTESTGKVIYKQDLTKSELITLNELQPGIYLVHLFNELGYSKIFRLVKD